MGTSSHFSDAEYVVAVANDAHFLFKRLRQIPATQAVAERLTPPQIVAWLRDNGGGSVDSVRGLAQVYVYLVALSLFDRGDVLPAIKGLALPLVPWAREILTEIDNSLRATDQQVITNSVNTMGQTIATSSSVTMGTSHVVSQDFSHGSGGKVCLGSHS